MEKGILKEEQYRFRINRKSWKRRPLTTTSCKSNDLNHICIDTLKADRQLKILKIKAVEMMDELCSKGIAQCTEVRYDFKNTKISTGLNGINRVFLPTARVYPTLVASDTNDFITDITISGTTAEEYKANFIREVYEKRQFPAHHKRGSLRNTRIPVRLQASGVKGDGG